MQNLEERRQDFAILWALAELAGTVDDDCRHACEAMEDDVADVRTFAELEPYYVRREA